MLVWLDLETTGLNPKLDCILEVGVILTDDKLNRVATYQSTLFLSPAHPALLGMNDFVRGMHTKSGLLDETKVAPYPESVRQELCTFLDTFEVNSKTCYLAGNSVHFDRSFLAEHMPEVLNRVSHRMLDVSTLKVIAAIWDPETYNKTPKEPAHRVLDDLENSMRELQQWRALMFKPGFGPQPEPVPEPPHEWCGKCHKCEQETPDDEPELCPICDKWGTSTSCSACGWKARILKP